MQKNSRNIVLIWVALPNLGKAGVRACGGAFCYAKLTLHPAALLIACTQFGRTIRGYTSALTCWLHCQSQILEKNLDRIISATVIDFYARIYHPVL